VSNQVWTDNTTATGTNTGIAGTHLWVQSNPAFNNNTILNANGNTGRVGIGTITPEAKLDITQPETIPAIRVSHVHDAHCGFDQLYHYSIRISPIVYSKTSYDRTIYWTKI